MDVEVPKAAVFLDATKAFDSLDWPFLFTLLPRLGLSPNFIKLIKLLYTKPTARLRINGMISDPFPITRGTRQGCPLSPLLFAVAMELLAARLLQHHSPKGLVFTDRGLLISMHADDITLYIKHPAENLNPVLREILRFGGLSGINLNWAKSSILPITDTSQDFNLEFTLQWAPGEVKYLGIWLSRDVDTILRMNYGKLVDWLEERIKYWVALPLSITGRIVILKMIVLPKFLYLFSNIPIPLTKAFFATLKSHLITLVWAGGQPRLQWDLLTRPLTRGGLGAPDLELYALCAQAQYLHFWAYPQPFQPHVAVEQDVAEPMPLSVAVYHPYKRSATEINTVNTLHWAWEGLRKRLQLPLLYAPTIPLAHHPNFHCLQTAGAIKWARDMGLSTMGDLYPLDNFFSIPEAVTDNPVSLMDTFLYHQLTSTCKAIYPTFPKLPSVVKPLHNLLLSPSPRRLVSRLYTSTQSDTQSTPPMAFLQWQEDLGEEFTEKH